MLVSSINQEKTNIVYRNPVWEDGSAWAAAACYINSNEREIKKKILYIKASPTSIYITHSPQNQTCWMTLDTKEKNFSKQNMLEADIQKYITLTKGTTI